jgi:AcrR family transcriptional regulator
MNEIRTRGRPRSTEARTAILDAALHLLQTGEPKALTMESIAAEARVSKATLYRWWKSPSAIALEGFLEAVSPQIAWPESPTLREALIGQATLLIRLLTETSYGCTVRRVLADGQTNDELREAFVEKFLLPRRAAAEEVMVRAQERGELRRDIEFRTVLDMIYGPVYLRLLTRYAPLDVPFIERLVDTALRGLEPRPDEPHVSMIKAG